MLQKPIELTVNEAMRDISLHSMASLNGLVSVHTSVFRNIPLMKTYVDLVGKPGFFVAEKFGSVKIPVVSELERGIDYKMAKLMDGSVCVQKVVGEKFISYSLKGNVDNPFNKGWLGLGRQMYHYTYSVKVDLVIAPLPAFGTA